MRRTQRSPRLRPTALLLCLAIGTSAQAAFQIGVTFNDPTNAYTAYYSPIAANLQAAGANWAGRIEGSGTIQVEVGFSGMPTTTGASATSGFLFSDTNYSYFEQGAAYKIRTGIDNNGTTPDAYLNLGTGYLQNDLWFDPTPSNRTTPVPTDKVDAYSVLLHELGHILVFNGWRDPTTGELPSAYMSSYDAQIAKIGSNFFLDGPLASQAYGGPVPLTTGALTHLGNAGSDLVDDLMNGVSLARGRRYDVSALDLAIAADAGLTLKPAAVPEPASVALFALGGTAFVVVQRRRRTS